MKVDYLIIGQGISGTMLSWNLLRLGKTVMVLDEPRENSSSKVCSGVINPVTGRRIVKTWMIEELIPFAWKNYGLIGEELGETVIRQCNLLDFHPTRQMEEAFKNRYEHDTHFLKFQQEDRWEEFFNFKFGIGEIDPCLLVDMNLLLDKWREQLSGSGFLREERFEFYHLSEQSNSIRYKDITAAKLIFCNGVDSYSVPYFSLLPYSKNKGEAVIAEIPGLPDNYIYKQSLSIVPWKPGLFWVGSTYEWDYPDIQPTESFRKKVEEQFDFWLKLPYRIIGQMAAERPATVERRPFVGLHPQHASIGILNGMGTKGVSLAPFFARQLAEHLVHNSPITPEADVQRFSRLLTKVFL